VIRRVTKEHRQREPRALRTGAEPALDQGLIPALAEPRVAQEGRDVGVPGQDVEAERVAMDRISVRSRW
jgi:hypothetical protein